MTVFYKSQKIADLLGLSLTEVRDLSDVGRLTTKLEDGEMLVAADSLVDLADDNTFSFLKSRFPTFAKSRGLGTGSLFSIGSVANLLGADNTNVLDMVNIGALGSAVPDGDQMISGDSLRKLIIGDQHKYGSLIPSLGDFALSQIGLDKVSGFGIPSVAEHLNLDNASLRSLISGGAIGTIVDEGNEYIEAESLNRYIQGEPAYANSKHKLGNFIFSQLGFDASVEPDLPSYETIIAADLPPAPDIPDIDGGGIGLTGGAIGAGVAGVVGVSAAGISGKLPDVDLPDVDLPDVDLPDVDLPDVDLPRVDFPDVDLPQVDVPDVNLPDVPDVPDVNVPGVDLPDVPDVSVPDVNLPDAPDVNVPDIDLPDVPDVSVPDVNLPNVPDIDVPDMPDMSVPDVDLPDVGVPDVDMPALGVGDVGPPSVTRPDFTPDMGLPKWLSPALIIALIVLALLLALTQCSDDGDDEVEVTTSEATPIVFNPIGAAVEDEVETNEDGLVPTVERTATNTPRATRTSRPDPTSTPRPLTSFIDNIGENDTFSTLAGALSATGLDSALEDDGPYTLFAPVNSAFGDAPAVDDDDLSELLTYHVVEGNLMAEDVVGLDSVTTLQGEELAITVEDGAVFVNGAKVIGTDAEMENGVMHIIDGVLVPTSLIPPEPTETPEPTEPPEPTETPEPTEAPTTELNSIVEIVGGADTFSILADALSSTGLISALEGDGPFTVFAPRNGAFEALPEGTLESLSDDQLRDVLLYHVVDGKLMSGDVVALDSVTTLLGEDVVITVDGGTVLINDATVVATDFEARNGVIHLIDGVLIPGSPPAPTTPTETLDPDDTVMALMQQFGSLSTLTGALDATGLASALGEGGPFTVLAPANSAFDNLPEGTLESLSDDQLRDVLLYHVIDGSAKSDVVAGLSSAETLQGEDVEITADGGNVLINGAGILVADLEKGNGVVHVIDTVLLPPSLSGGTDGESGASDSGDGEGTTDDSTDSGTDDGTDSGTDDGTDSGTDDGAGSGAGEAAANVHIIMDASWSMTLPPDTSDESQRLDVDDPNNRISLAREAVIDLVTNDIPEGTPIGLRAFGNMEGNYSCRTDLMAVPGELDGDALAELITGLEPQFNANTPLAASIAAIPSDIAELEGRTVVILITDGAETCFGEPGTAAVNLGAPRKDISLNIIGLSIDDDRTRGNLERIAEIGEGSYYDVTDIDQFSDALKATLE